MKTIFLTGSSGFVGTNLKSYLIDKYQFINLNRNSSFRIYQEYVIHLSGKAHDLRNTSNSDEYYQVNTELTKKIFDVFIASEAEVFITLSSVKAVADQIEGELTEEQTPNPLTHYGKSKLLAEQYIFSKPIPEGKRVYVLRPCMIHGPGNKGNLNLLHKLANKQLPWPLAAFENKRSFCSIDNLCFIIKELIERKNIPSGIYNVADDEPVSTNQLMKWMAETQGKKPILLSTPKGLINIIAKIGDKLRLPLNSERLQKLTESYVVSNSKIKMTMGKDLPVSAKDGLVKTFKSFSNNV